MRHCYVLFAWTFWFASATLAGPQVPAGQPKAGAASEPEPSFAGVPPLPREAGIGEHVTFEGKNLPPLATVVTVFLKTASDDDKPKALPGVVTSDPNKPNSRLVDFRIEDLQPLRYLVAVGIDKKQYPVPGELRVVSPRNAHLEELKPGVAYPEKFWGNFTVNLSGQNLGTARKDIVLEVEGEGPVPLDTKAVCNADAKLPCAELDENLPGQVLKIRNFPNRQGSKRLRVRVADGPPSNFIPVIFSFAPQSSIRPITLAIVGVLIIVIVAVLLGGQHLRFTAARHFISQALLLDQQTNTFSLSKFQLLVWTGATVFAYIYLFLCRSLVQWSFEIPPIPDGLPNLLLMSVGTTVLSAGITGVRGAKGAGPESPSFADFFSTGGMVVGERFQFFLWTIVAVLGFIGIVMMTDPATMVKLPEIPEGFLPLMGISAVGYLGGKLARKPGPIVKTLAITNVDEVAHTITMTLQGENLSSNATFQVDDQLLRADQVVLTPVKREDADSNLCTQIEVLLRDADAYAVGTHSLKIINTDGQTASATFPRDAMTITVPDGGIHVKGGVPEAQLELTGTNFDDKVQATWKPVGADSATAATVSFVSTTKVIVKFNPGSGGGKGQLVLISKARLKAAVDVLVVV
ncbi:MAG TPA: hypothetical protein VE422_08250 [Terriglobia bacterium]|nr:hypothetical protein [Terriglobia bacterium]